MEQKIRQEGGDTFTKRENGSLMEPKEFKWSIHPFLRLSWIKSDLSVNINSDGCSETGVEFIDKKVF